LTWRRYRMSTLKLIGAHANDIERKERRLKALRHQILAVHDQVMNKSIELKKEKHDHTHASLSKTRNMAHSIEKTNDMMNRPCDQQRMTRTYGKMDADLWTRDEVRLWFNQYAPDKDEDYKFIPSKTGYTLLAENR